MCFLLSLWNWKTSKEGKDGKVGVGLIILHMPSDNCKTAITLSPPTVGRQSADLSADDRPIYRPIKCQILALFSLPTKINYNYLVIFFFSIGRQFWGFGNQPMIGRWSADDRPMIGR